MLLGSNLKSRPSFGRSLVIRAGSERKYEVQTGITLSLTSSIEGFREYINSKDAIRLSDVLSDVLRMQEIS